MMTGNNMKDWNLNGLNGRVRWRYTYTEQRAS